MQVLEESIWPCAGQWTVTIPAGTTAGQHLIAVAAAGPIRTPWRTSVLSAASINVRAPAEQQAPSPLGGAGVAALLQGPPRRPGSTFSIPLRFAGFQMSCVSTNGLLALRSALQRDLAAGLAAFRVSADDVAVDWLRSGPLAADPQGTDSIISISVLIAASPTRPLNQTQSQARSAAGMIGAAIKSSGSTVLAQTIMTASGLMDGAVVSIATDVTESCRRLASQSGSSGSTLGNGCSSWIAADGKVRAASLVLVARRLAAICF